MGFMPNIIATKVNWAYLYQKKKDVPTPIKMLGERLFPCHFILIHSCASVGMKWLFFNFTLKALRFLKITRIWSILLNVFCSLRKPKTHTIQLTDNQKTNNFTKVCTTSFCYVFFDLALIISYFFKKRKFLYSKKAGCACTHVAGTISLTSHLANLIQRNFLHTKKSGFTALALRRTWKVVFLLCAFSKKYC